MGKKHGSGVFKWPNGKIYDGGWHLGKKSGQGVVIDIEDNI